MRKYVRIAQWLSHTILVGYLAGVLMCWLKYKMPFGIFSLTYTAPGKALSFFSEFSFSQHVGGFLPDSIAAVMLFLGWHTLQKLFACFMRDEIFSERVASHFYRLGKLAFGWVCYVPLQRVLMSVINSWHRGPGNRVLAVTVSGGDLVNIMACLLLLIIAFIMKQGAQMKEEHELTV